MIGLLIAQMMAVLLQVFINQRMQLGVAGVRGIQIDGLHGPTRFTILPTLFSMSYLLSFYNFL